MSKEMRAHKLDLSITGIREGYSHYHKHCPYEYVDVYRVLEMFQVTDPCLQHAIKKLLVAGSRGGGKDMDKDIAEVIVTLTRWQQMQEETVAWLRQARKEHRTKREYAARGKKSP